MAIDKLGNEYFLSKIKAQFMDIKQELDMLKEFDYPVWLIPRKRRQLFKNIYHQVLNKNILPSIEEYEEILKIKGISQGWSETLYRKEEDALKIIQYPAWLYKFAKNILPDKYDWDLLLHKLPTMTEDEIRSTVEGYVYGNIYGSGTFHNMARKAWEGHLLIEKALSEFKHPVVMSSWGKDSNVVLHMVMMHKQDVWVLWNDTTVEFPSTYRLKDRIVKEWQIKNLIRTKPTTTFWAIKNQYGWPTKGRGVGDIASEKCCKLLKKDPTKKALEGHNFDLSFTGLNINESWQRKVSGEKYGNYFYSKTWKMQRCYPIHDWTLQEIWDYTIFWGLPVNEVYRPLPVGSKHSVNKTEEELVEKWRMYPDEPDTIHWNDLHVVQSHIPGYEPRTSCWPCTIGSKFGKLGFYRIFFPKLYNTLIFQQGLGLELLNKATGEEATLFPPDMQELKTSVAMRPCIFDKF